MEYLNSILILTKLEPLFFRPNFIFFRPKLFFEQTFFLDHKFSGLTIIWTEKFEHKFFLTSLIQNIIDLPCFRQKKNFELKFGFNLFCGPNIFGPNILWIQRFQYPKFCFCAKFPLTQVFFDQRFFGINIFGTPHFFEPKFVWPKQFFGPIFSGP